MTPKKQDPVKHWSPRDLTYMYRAARRLPRQKQIALGLVIPVDIYVQDPLVARRHAEALGTVYLTYEPDLRDGPTSARIAVVDYDGDRDRLEPPARLEWDGGKKTWRFFDPEGRPVSDCRDSPQFRQVNAWATVQDVLDLYEASWVLGRSAPWAFEGNRLIVVPHAGYLPNAFYDRHSKSLQFYYFGPEAKRVYTCLSHDIIAHETGHAILDGLRPLYLEDSSLQTTAFHEFVADLTAIVSSILNSPLRWLTLEMTQGDLDRDDLISGLAEEFGKNVMGSPHLRSARNSLTMADVQASPSAYKWSQVLTGTMFDILKGMARMHMQRALKSGNTPSPKQALWWAADAFRRVALQPLDYLPPVDVQFADYARAVLRSEKLSHPADESDYQDLIRQAFKARGIADLEEEEKKEEALPHNLGFYQYEIERISRSRTDAYHFLNENRRQLCIPLEQDVSVVDLYRTNKTVRGGGRLPQEIVLQYMWREDVHLQKPGMGPLQGQRVSLLCGGTLVFDGRGNLLHWVRKPGTGGLSSHGSRRRAHCAGEREKGQERRTKLLDYVAGRVGLGLVGLAEEGDLAGPSVRQPIVTGRQVGGTVRLEVRPHLRHWAEGRGG